MLQVRVQPEVVVEAVAADVVLVWRRRAEVVVVVVVVGLALYFCKNLLLQFTVDQSRCRIALTP